MSRTVLVLALLACGSFSWSAAVRADDPPVAPAAPAPGPFEPGAPTFSDLKAKAKAAGRLLLLEFASASCRWCRKLETEALSQPEAATALGAFVCARLDAEVGEGKELARRYAVSVLPTLVVVDADGSEVDRIVEYVPLERLVAEVERIAKGEGTLPALRKAVEASPGDFRAALTLARRELFTVEPARALDLLERVRAVAKERREVVAVEQMTYVWHQQQAAHALKRWGAAAGDDPEELNLVAWTAYLQQVAPRQALDWARRAVDLSRRDPAILDTLASLLHRAGEHDEAIALEEEAVKKAVDPGIRLELLTNVAMWKAAREVRKAHGAGAPPAAPTPADEK